MKRAYRRQLEQPDDMQAEPEDASGSSDVASNDVEVYAFWEALSPLQRRIVACLLAGYTWRETGDIIGCTSANIAYHMRRIRDLFVLWHNAL